MVWLVTISGLWPEVFVTRIFAWVVCWFLFCFVEGRTVLLITTSAYVYEYQMCKYVQCTENIDVK